MRSHVIDMYSEDPFPRCGVILRRFFSFVLSLVCVYTVSPTAFAQHWVRPTAVCYIGYQSWLVADAGNGDLTQVDTLLRTQKLSYPGRLSEPVSLVRDALSFICFDRNQHAIFRINRRFESISTTPLPDEYRNRFATSMSVTPFGETVFIDRDRNELVAIDAFGRETWHVTLPGAELVLSMVSARDSLYVLFDTTRHVLRIASFVRYGAGMRWIALPDSFAPLALAVAPGDSLLAISSNAVWNVREKSIPFSIPTLVPPIIAVAASETHLLVINPEGVRIVRWR